MKYSKFKKVHVPVLPNNNKNPNLVKKDFIPEDYCNMGKGQLQ